MVHSTVMSKGIISWIASQEEFKNESNLTNSDE
jgi:hypothetical protein